MLHGVSVSFIPRVSPTLNSVYRIHPTVQKYTCCQDTEFKESLRFGTFHMFTVPFHVLYQPL